MFFSPVSPEFSTLCSLTKHSSPDSLTFGIFLSVKREKFNIKLKKLFCLSNLWLISTASSLLLLGQWSDSIHR